MMHVLILFVIHAHDTITMSQSEYMTLDACQQAGEAAVATFSYDKGAVLGRTKVKFVCSPKYK